MAGSPKKPTKKGARIPEGAQDMPGGPQGGKPITPPKKKKKTKRAS
jgi:hypothetical protein